MTGAHQVLDAVLHRLGCYAVRQAALDKAQNERVDRAIANINKAVAYYKQARKLQAYKVARLDQRGVREGDLSDARRTLKRMIKSPRLATKIAKEASILTRRLVVLASTTEAFVFDPEYANEDASLDEIEATSDMGGMTWGQVLAGLPETGYVFEKALAWAETMNAKVPNSDRIVLAYDIACTLRDDVGIEPTTGRDDGITVPGQRYGASYSRLLRCVFESVDIVVESLQHDMQMGLELLNDPYGHFT